jgi:hypothetical protein
MPEELLSFIEENMPTGWTTHREVTPCRNLIDGSACPSMISLQAVNGSAFLGVDPMNLNAPVQSYDVYVDHDSHLADLPPASVPLSPTLAPAVR